MILATGRWFGRGACRAVDGAAAVRFEVRADVAAHDDGFLIEAVKSAEGMGVETLMIWVTPDDAGAFTVVLQGGGAHARGTAKLESEPNLGLLWAEDADVHIAFALFTGREVYGLRGFAKKGGVAWTWELALRRDAPPDDGEQAQPATRPDNVISLASRRRR